jgi:hypothetical protein
VANLTIYNDGSKYGDGSLYGRIEPELLAAQQANVRETALRVKVIDHHINDWTLVAGTALSTSPLSVAGTTTKQQLSYWYRLQMDMIILDNGTIVRVRNGDGSAGDRQIWYQEITDPTVASQWTSWSVKYSGTHYSVALAAATASTYHVYSSKSDGVYKNNALKEAYSNIVDIAPVRGQTDAMFLTVVITDALDSGRVLDLRYCNNIESVGFADDVLNWRWNRTYMSALKLDDGRIARLQVASFQHDPRAATIAESMAICFGPSYTNVTPVDPPYMIRGFAGQAGFNAITYPTLTKLSDGYYYVFYGEYRLDADKENAISVATLFWQRSKDLYHWSEPVAIGYDNMNPTGVAVVEKGGYVYLANNGAVYRRPTAVTEYDISNYISKLDMNIPTSLEDGRASFPIANLDGINDYLQDLGDRELTIEVGLKVANGTYQYTEFNDWWVDRVTQKMQNKVNRLSMSAYDIFRRLSNPLRDTYNFIGQVAFNDWYLGRANKLFNYYIRGGKPSFVKSSTSVYYQVRRIARSQFTLYTGWKGHNFDVTIRFRGGSIVSRRWGVVYRYVNSKNYYWARITNDEGTLQLVRYRNGTGTVLASYSISGGVYNPTIKVVTRYGFHYIYLKQRSSDTLNLRITHNETTPSVAPGYVGMRYYSAVTHNYQADLFSLTTWETNYTTDDLVKTALSIADLHDYVVAAGTERQLAIVWGPQTELANPAAALKELFTQYKLDMTWRNNILTVGQFKELEIIKTIQNESLSFDNTEESGQHINLASVDGQEDSYIAIDGPDTRARGRQIVAYFDVPELDTTEGVVARANEEIRQGVEGTKYNGETPLFFDLWRLDGVRWYDPAGVAHDLRIHSIEVTIDQSTEPSQHGRYELSPLT